MSAPTLQQLQARTLEALRESFRSEHRAVMLYGPTGFGKTELAISLMETAASKGKLE